MTLHWYPEFEYGEETITPRTYDLEYYEKYVGYSKTELGHHLTQFRSYLVKKYTKWTVLDVGPGDGSFIKAHGSACGLDVNTEAIQAMRRAGLNIYMWHQLPLVPAVAALTFWDSFEHIPLRDLDILVRQFHPRLLFLTVPIVPDIRSVMQWKHYRKDEHCLYFTAKGLDHILTTKFHWKYSLIHRNTRESALGREDVETFVYADEKYTLSADNPQ